MTAIDAACVPPTALIKEIVIVYLLVEDYDNSLSAVAITRIASHVIQDSHFLILLLVPLKH